MCARTKSPFTAGASGDKGWSRVEWIAYLFLDKYVLTVYIVYYNIDVTYIPSLMILPVNCVISLRRHHPIASLAQHDQRASAPTGVITWTMPLGNSYVPLPCRA
jgi:hypothetical protein